jgi:hypothetical protein
MKRTNVGLPTRRLFPCFSLGVGHGYRPPAKSRETLLGPRQLLPASE